MVPVTQANVSDVFSGNSNDSSNKLEKESSDYLPSKTELDSHANMAVVGENALIIEDTGKTVDVKPFTSECKTLDNVHIVDALIKFENAYDGSKHISMIKNALHVPSMSNNLIPPFLIREAGVEVRDVPKIHVEDPHTEDHSIFFKDANVRIPLSLNGIFSYFPSGKPTEEEVEECEEILFLTPLAPWDPYSDVYARNEEAMVDHEGIMRELEDRIKILLSEVAEDAALSSTIAISSVETQAIDQTFENREPCLIDHYSLDMKRTMDPMELCSLWQRFT